MKAKRFLFTAAFMLAATFALSCSSGGGGGGNICNPEYEDCVNGEISSSGGGNQGDGSSSSNGGWQGGSSSSVGSGWTWTAVANSTFGTSIIRAIAYGNGTWVAGGNDGKMAYSSDGITWTPVEYSTFPAGYEIYAIAYGNGMWIAGGQSGKIWYSTGN